MDIAQTRAIILFITAFLNLILVFILWFKGKSKATFHFGISALFSAAYAFAYGGSYVFANKLLWNRAAWFGAVMLPAYIIFIYYFTGRTKHIKLKVFLWYLSVAIILFLNFFTPYFSSDYFPKYPWIAIKGPLDPVGRIYVIGCLALILFYLLRDYFRSKGFRKSQLKYFIIGTSTYAMGGIIGAGVIPLIWSNFPYADSSALFSIFMVALTTYAIFKRRLFKIRIILTELLVVAITLILFIQLLSSESLQARILGLITFFSFLFVGYLLIRVTQNEIERKEQAEGLTKELKEFNETLERRVKERTKELEASYQEIKKRKDDLEKFYKLTVGRELKMIELEQEIEGLQKKLKK